MPTNEAFAVSSEIEADARSVCMDIVWELAGKLDCDPIDVEPIGKSIDADALETIIESSEDATVLFDHAGCTVEVSTVGSETSVFVTRKGQAYD